MNLIVIEPHEAAEASDPRRGLTLGGSRATHLRRILRVEPGRQVRVGLLDGPFGIATVTAVTESGVTVECRFDGETPARPRVDLLLALPRPKVMRRLWAQLSALGVGQIILTNAARVERNYFDTHVLEAACYRPLLIEGLQQARDTRLPAVSIHRQFRKLIEDELDRVTDADVRFIADPDNQFRNGVGSHLRDAQMTPDPITKLNRALLAVGPEGGWNDFERELLHSRGFQPVALGPRTLRTDTACIALLTLVHEALRR